MPISAADLIARLREIHTEGERLSDENLVAKIPISGSTLARWKKGDTRSFDQIVQMLEDAGWLNTGAGAPEQARRSRDRLQVIEEGVIALLAGQDQLLEKEGIARRSAPSASQSRARAAPKKRAVK